MFFWIPSLKLTARPLKMDGWNTAFLLGRPKILWCYVSFREGIPKTEIIPIQIPRSRLKFADKTFRTKFSYR